MKPTNTAPERRAFLSVVIPAYNEENIIKASLEKARSYFDNNISDYEIIVVDDGSSDRTAALAADFSKTSKKVRVISNAHREGKGFSVKRGVLECKGDHILISDADLSAPLEELERLWPSLDNGSDIAIGSRFNFNSKINTRVRQRLSRRILGMIFNLCVRALVMGGIRDTQCGFKLMKSSAGKDIFKAVKTKGFAFDVEMLYLARMMNYSVKEVPINWTDTFTSKVSHLKDPWKMLWDLIRIRCRYFEAAEWIKNVKNLLINQKFIRRKPLLAFRIFLNYMKILVFRRKVLRVVDFVIDYRCQCKCKFCSQAKLMGLEKKRLSLDEIGKVLKDVIRLGAINIHFVGGEPLLCDDLYKIIRLSQPRISLVSMATNGLLIRKEMGRLKRSGFDVFNVSIDSPFPERHDANKGIEGCFKEAMEGIKAAKREGFRVIMSTVVTHENLNNGEIDKQIELAKILDVDLQLLPARALGRWEDREDILLTEEDMKRFYKLASGRRLRWDGRSNYLREGCPAGVERIYIDIFGNVTPCDFVHLSFGNVLEEPIDVIWKRMREAYPFNKWSRICRSAFDARFKAEFMGPIARSPKIPCPYAELPVYEGKTD